MWLYCSEIGMKFFYYQIVSMKSLFYIQKKNKEIFNFISYISFVF